MNVRRKLILQDKLL